jgi:hypothetical protein
MIVSLALASPPSRATPPPQHDKSFWVFFKANSADLEEPTLQTLKLVANEAANHRGPILVTGRQDPAENDVAWGRAGAVALKLKELGVPPARIFVGSRNALDATTCVQAPEHFSTCNARVEITVCVAACSDGFQQRFDFNPR